MQSAHRDSAAVALLRKRGSGYQQQRRPGHPWQEHELSLKQQLSKSSGPDGQTRSKNGRRALLSQDATAGASSASSSQTAAPAPGPCQGPQIRLTVGRKRGYSVPPFQEAGRAKQAGRTVAAPSIVSETNRQFLEFHNGEGSSCGNQNEMPQL